MSLDSSSFQALSARLEVLERQTRSLKRSLVAALVFVLVLGAASAGIAQQHALSFSGANGTLSISADGIFFYDKNHKARLAEYISSDSHEPVFRLRDSAGRDAAYFGLTATEQPRIEFLDTSDQERLYVGLSSQQGGLVRLYATNGKEQSSLEDGFLDFYDTNGTKKVAVGVATDDSPLLKMFDASQTVRVYAGIYTDGNAGFASYTSSGTSQWSSP